MKVYIEPTFRGQDKGDGGIRRVVEAQRRHLPSFGVEVVDAIDDADLVASHGGSQFNIPPGKPWVTHTHGLYWAEYEWDRWHHDLNAQVIAAMRHADHVTAPSEWVAQTLRRGMWLRPTVLPHGVDLEEWGPGQRKGYVLWNKTRVDPICDPAPLLTLAAQAPDLDFVTTFGDTSANVQRTGRLPYLEAKDLIQNAAIYLQTTRETFGIGFLEAMASGVPVVGWDWGGQAEVIQHRVTGWLAQPGDIAGLEEGIRWALDNRIAVTDAAYLLVNERYTWPIAIKRYAHLYRRMLDQQKARVGMPRVSVVIPCYNLARFLPDAVRSVQAQTMKDWEIVIVDDASPDDTRAVSAALVAEDDRIRVLRNEKNLYLAGALNAGIAEAHGRYIVPLDADNMIEPGTLEVWTDALDGDRDLDIAYGGARFVLEDGKTPDSSVAPDGVSGWPKEFSFRAQMLKRNQIPSTAMYRREVWERGGGYRSRYRTAEDAEFWTRGSSQGAVPRKVTNAPTLIYRQRPNSMSRNEPEPDWVSWFPWSLRYGLVPFGVAERPPRPVNGGLAWNVPSCEPVRVAVVIPVGPGHEKLLIDALDSVEAQTYRQWECIVANDTGKPLAIPHPWVTVVDTGGGKGPAAARNMAIAASKAPLFVPLDADDYLQSDALQDMFDVWSNFGGFVYSQWYDDSGDGTSVYDPPEYDAHLLISKGTIHAVTGLYARADWVDLGGFDEELTHWEDWDWQLKLANAGICGTKIAKPLFTYRKHTGFRREENMAAFEEGKAAILAKWAPWWDGKEVLMACSGCSKGGGVAKPPTMPQQQGQNGSAVMAAREGYTILEYAGGGGGRRTYRGKSTGTSYKFGSDPAHRRKYVYVADAEALLSLFEPGGTQKLFRSVEPIVARAASPTLQTASAPVREGPAPSHDHSPRMASPLHRTVGAASLREGAETVTQPPPPPPEQNRGAPGDAPGDLSFPIESGPLPPVHAHDHSPATPPQVGSIKELRLRIPHMTIAAVQAALAQEEAGARRSSALMLLHRRLGRLKGKEEMA